MFRVAIFHRPASDECVNTSLVVWSYFIRIFVYLYGFPHVFPPPSPRSLNQPVYNYVVCTAHALLCVDITSVVSVAPVAHLCGRLT